MRGFSFALVRTMESIILSFVLLLYAILPKSQALHRKFTSATVRLLLGSTSPSALTRCHLPGSTSPSRLTPCHLPYRGEALAFRKVFLPSSKFSSPPEAPLLGELSAKQTERLYEGEPDLFHAKRPLHFCSGLFSENQAG